MKRTWFFDLDGTLADTERDIREAWKATLVDLGISCVDFDARFIAGPPMDEMAKMLFPDLYSEELVARIRKGFAGHYDNDGFPNTHEYPGMLDVVRRLRSRGAQTFIVTNKRFLGATAQARHFGWDKIFDGLYTGDMYPSGKLRKDALMAKIMCERNIVASDAIMVGDTILDFEAARANGVKSIGVTWGYGKRDDLEKADILVDSVAAFAALVEAECNS